MDCDPDIFDFLTLLPFYDTSIKKSTTGVYYESKKRNSYVSNCMHKIRSTGGSSDQRGRKTYSQGQ